MEGTLDWGLLCSGVVAKNIADEGSCVPLAGV